MMNVAPMECDILRYLDFFCEGRGLGLGLAGVWLITRLKSREVAGDRLFSRPAPRRGDAAAAAAAAAHARDALAPGP